MWRVLTWNLYHGRSIPPSGIELLEEFGRAIAAWEWDVALLQEVPPWWPGPLARRASADERHVLTSRNFPLFLRRRAAQRWPDLMKSNGGGCNAILVRDTRIVEDRSLRLCVLPERRWVHGVRLLTGAWVANLHATAHDPPAAHRDVKRATQAAREWADGAPLVLGGDFNRRELELPGLARIGGHDVDHVFAAGLEADAPAATLDHGKLSDHAPVLATFA